jgi:hypothetical protein
LHFEAICNLNLKYPDLLAIELLPYHTMGNSKRTSIGIGETLLHLETVPHEMAEEWITQLKELGCMKVKLG